MTLDVRDEFAELYFLQEELVFPGRVSEQDFGFVGMEFIFLDIIICESFDVHYYYYCCMNKKNTGKYFNHVQNTSPAKTAFSFKKNKRFPTEKTHSPDKFYDAPINTFSRRSTSIGFGKKTNFINYDASDPGRYNSKSAFDYSNPYKITSFNGVSRQQIYQRIYNNKVPGPGRYQPQSSKKIKFYIGKSEKLPNAKFKDEVGPQTYNLQQNIKRLKGLRMRTQYREKSPLDHYDNRIPGPGTYNPQRKSDSKIRNTQCGTFGKSEKLRLPKAPTNLGPGQYKLFSVFGGGDEEC